MHNYFIPECNIDKITVLLDNKKKISQVFVIPYHLKETSMAVHTWGFETHQMIGK